MIINPEQLGAGGAGTPAEMPAIKSYLDLGFSPRLQKDIRDNPFQNSSYQSLLQFQSMYEGVDPASIVSGTITGTVTSSDPNVGAGLEPASVGGGTGASSSGAQITGDSFKVGSGINSVTMDANGFYAGDDVFTKAPFSVDKAGHVFMASATISGYLTVGSAADDVNTHTTKIFGDLIVSGTITGTQIAAATITSTNLASNSVDNTKIVGGTITASKLVNGTITTTQIAGGTITAANIATGTLTSASGVFGVISANDISTGTLNASVVTVTNLNASNINTGTLNGVPVAGNQVTSGINGANINASSITAGKLSVASLSAISANLGTITAGSISAVTISGSTITSTIFTSNTQNYTDGGGGHHQVGTKIDAIAINWMEDGSSVGNLAWDYDGSIAGNAGIYTASALTTGDTYSSGTKHFNIPHPTKENMRLQYASVESPEILLVCRGSSASRDLPQHFIDVTEEGTVQFINDPETGNWIATAVRKGYAGYDPELPLPTAQV